jgi:hypothetical protein
MRAVLQMKLGADLGSVRSSLARKQAASADWLHDTKTLSLEILANLSRLADNP